MDHVYSSEVTERIDSIFRTGIGAKYGINPFTIHDEYQ